jgi:hypothetical protein
VVGINCEGVVYAKLHHGFHTNKKNGSTTVTRSTTIQISSLTKSLAEVACRRRLQSRLQKALIKALKEAD